MLLLCGGLVACGESGGANEAERAAQGEATAPDDTGEPVAPDNTGRNAQDSEQALTSGDQSEQEADVAATREIRRALTSDDSLSTQAKNVKIITRDGVVTLRGPVENAQEQAAIEAIARRTAGVSRVDNQLEVAPDQEAETDNPSTTEE
jgi:osmotically-inducible protein OsmY